MGEKTKARAGKVNEVLTLGFATFALLVFSERTTVTEEEIKGHLKQVKYPGFSRDIVSFGLVRAASFDNGTVHVALGLTSGDPKTPLQLKAEVEKCLLAVPGVKRTVIDVAVAPAPRPS